MIRLQLVLDINKNLNFSEIYALFQNIYKIEI